VRSGHKVGKSILAVVIAIWWVMTRPRGQVVLTAPTFDQILDPLWLEFARLHKAAAKRGVPLGGRVRQGQNREFELPGDRFIRAISTNHPDKMSGRSGSNRLFIVDEAFGYDEGMWDPILGNLGGGGHLLALGNPTRTSGRLFEAFHTGDELWKTFQISSAQSPNVVTGRNVIDGLATREFIRETLLDECGIVLDETATYDEIIEAVRSAGLDSPFLNVRVLGEFPAQASNAIFGLAYVEESCRRNAQTPTEGRLRVGVDVARYGDDESVIAPRRGKHCFPLEAHRGLDGPQLAGQVHEYVLSHALPGEIGDPQRRPHVNVDVIGVGASCFDALKRMAGDAYSVCPINVAEKAFDEDKYINRRSEIWFAGKKWLLGGGSIPNDTRLKAELVAPVYTLDERGRYVVEKKDAIKKRLKRSPDRADAFLLSLPEPPVVVDDDWSMASASSDWS
jgi:hypothetical protein